MYAIIARYRYKTTFTNKWSCWIMASCQITITKRDAMRIAKNTKYYGPLNLTDISIKYKVDIYKSI